MNKCSYIFLILMFQLFAGLSFIEAQVSLVKDISPGADGSFTPSSNAGIDLDGIFIFPASNSEFGLELWISDGSDVGTFLLKDIAPGTGSSDPYDFFKAFGRVYFSAFTAEHGRELWVTDGTPDGTQLVMDIESGAEGSDPVPGDIYSGFLYFAATSNDDREVWRIDSLSTPHLFKDVNPNVSSRPRAFKSANGLLYFSANVAPIEFGSIDQDEPFVTDGTEFGTVHLDIEVESPAGGDVVDFTPLDSYVFFLASAMGGIEPSDIVLYYSQGDQFSTGILSSFFQSPIYWLMPVKGKINFCDEFSFYRLEADDFNVNVDEIARLANPLRKEEKKPQAYLNENLCIPGKDVDNDQGVELYFSDGDQTWLSNDIFAGTGSSDPWYIVSDGTKAVFAASSSDTDRELYESDGTAEGTKLVIDLNPGEEGSNPSHLVISGKNVFFYATTPETGYELYKFELEPNSVTNSTHFLFNGKVYPQPAMEGQTVVVEWSNKDDWEFAELVDQNGTVLKSYQIEGYASLSLDTKSIPSGLYFLNLSGKNSQSTCKVIIH